MEQGGLRRLMASLLLALAITGLSAILAGPTLASPVTYSYDALGRLVRVAYEDGRTIVYSYDAAGNRTAKESVISVPFVKTITISGSGPVNLRSLADAQGYDGQSPATITYVINAGTTITGAANGGNGLDTGTWPGGVAITLTLNNAGIIRGGGGRGGGVSDFSNGLPGSAGGHAVMARTNLSINNTGGVIQGGGGGGGGGDMVVDPWTFDVANGGGGGGGFPNGSGATGGCGSSSNGANGTTSGGGRGGSGCTSGSARGTPGANGGGAGQAGRGGLGQGANGAAGSAVRKNGNSVTVTGGTVTGAVG